MSSVFLAFYVIFASTTGSIAMEVATLDRCMNIAERLGAHCVWGSVADSPTPNKQDISQ